MGSNRPHTSPISLFLTENNPARQVNSMAPSPVDLNEMAPWLRQYARVNYRDANYLWVGFSFGFKLEFQGSRKGRLARNLRSATHQDTAGYVKQKLQKEVDLGRMAGPFKDTPLDNLQVSPIGLVPKKQPGYGQHVGKHAEEFRLIHHLSYPRGKSINDFIDTEACSVVYARFDEATHMVLQLGKGALLAKFDIQSAFRIIPVHPSDFELLGIRFEGEFYFDKCLPFGCSISCAIFETFSTFLQWCMQSHLPTRPIMHYLDDFLTGGTAGTSHCSDNLNGCVNTLEQLGVPIAHDKTVGPTTKLTFLGLEIDTIAMQIRIPEPKIKEATREIHDILSTGNIKVTKMALQSLIGKLNFMCRAIPMARAFSRRLIDLLSKGKQPFHHIRITSWVKEDLQKWLTFLTSYNGISVFQDQLWVDSDFLQLFSDAAGGAGFGAYMQGKWFNGAWPTQWVTDGTTRDLTLLELFPITLAIQIWGKQLPNKKVLFYCDNQAVVTIINKQSTKAPRVMSLLRRLILQCLRYNIMFKAKYGCSTANTIADALSRFQLKRFREAAPAADQNPTPIPCNIWLI
ncbi:uncharacterized protein LOC125379287 [Haliotis rufescens]|uniref:uncharacterized protein LOC125379287 n=1 Tax=Haliotis rufescens TaxID=6454 RepID=UPI00201E82E0|nr:uncharacterized protein LOC125379287 [Haliotis rufescens]